MFNTVNSSIVDRSFSNQVTASIEECFKSSPPAELNLFRRLEARSKRLEDLERRFPKFFVKKGYDLAPLDTIGRRSAVYPFRYR